MTTQLKRVKITKTKRGRQEIVTVTQEPDQPEVKEEKTPETTKKQPKTIL